MYTILNSVYIVYIVCVIHHDLNMINNINYSLVITDYNVIPSVNFPIHLEPHSFCVYLLLTKRFCFIVIFLCNVNYVLTSTINIIYCTIFDSFMKHAPHSNKKMTITTTTKKKYFFLN